MPTLIDSLVVALGLDAKDLEAKGPAATRQLDKIEKQGTKTEKTMRALSGTVETFLALIGGTVAIKAFINDFVNANAQLDRLSKNLNLSVDSIVEWGNATERVGGSSQAFQSTLSMLSREQTNLMLTGQSGLIPYFSAMGIAMGDASGHARKLTDMLEDMASFAEGKDRTTMHNLFAQMGIDEGTINLILEGRSALDLQLRKQKEYGEELRKFAPVASKLQDQIVGIKQKFTLLGLTLLTDAAPTIEKVLRLFEKFGNWILENRQFVEDFLKVLAVGLMAISVALGAVALANSPITLTIALVTLLAGAIALLWQDFQVWKEGGKSFINWSRWISDIQMVIGWIDKLRNAIEDLAVLRHPVTLIERGWNALKKTVSPSGQGVARAFAHQEGFFAKGSSPNRPQRNHNPGDLEYGDFARRHGAVGSDGRFAIFPDDATGMAALQALLDSPGYANLSLAQKINRFAPSNENNSSAYLRGVQKYLEGTPGASSFAANAPQGASGAGSVDRSVNVEISQIDVKTQATDAQGMAREMAPAMNYLFAAQANSGVW